MAAPADLPQVHGASGPALAPPLISNLGAAHRNCLLLALMDPAGDRAADAPARVLQARAGFPGL